MKRILFLLAILAFARAPDGAMALDRFPDRTVRIVVPYVPGVGADIASRLLSDRLKDIWGVPVIVDNRPGASGAIGTGAVIHSPPDGHTILVTGESIYSVYMSESPAYDPVRDITPVAQIIGLPFAFIARKGFPASNWSEFLAYARANPGKVTISTPGYGTPHHILAELLMRDVGLDLYQVPGTSGVLQDVIGERIDVTFQPASVVAPLLSTGLKVFAAGGMKRTTSIPAAPSFAELGVKALQNSDSGNGVFVANGTPPEAIGILARGLQSALADPVIASRLVDAGFTIAFEDSGPYARRVRETAGRWEAILKDVRGKQK